MRHSAIRPLAVALGIIVGMSACDNAGSSLGINLTKQGIVGVLVYLDRDGSHSLTPLDTLFVGAKVSLRIRDGGAIYKTVFTNALGQAVFDKLPLGHYQFSVDSASLGDSVFVAAVDSLGKVELTAQDSIIGPLLVRVAFPEVSIRKARSLPPGKRVFLRGVVLAGVQSFRDTTSYVQDSSGTVRLTRVTLRGAVGSTPGDSVSISGVTSARLGQPTLDFAALARFGAQPQPIPIPVTTGSAATAGNGALDAALVLISDAIISDTLPSAPDYKVVASDGSGSVTILLDGNINFPRAQFRPGHSMKATGVLVPTGAGTWVLKPRDVNDVIVF